MAIARAIAKRPAILIADEPTGNLDPAMTDEMITLLEKINKEEKTTLLVVTHNDVMVEFHPKRTIRIQSGHVVDDGMRAAAYASKMKATDKPNRGETMTKEERIQALREAEEADKNYVHKPHVLSESDAQEAKFNEITMQLDAIKEISEGGEE